jgi:hypothetical protein
VVSAEDPYGRIFGFLERSRYVFFQVAPQFYSRGRVDLVPDPLLPRKSGSAGNRSLYQYIVLDVVSPKISFYIVLARR